MDFLSTQTLYPMQQGGEVHDRMYKLEVCLRFSDNLPKTFFQLVGKRWEIHQDCLLGTHSFQELKARENKQKQKKEEKENRGRKSSGTVTPSSDSEFPLIAIYRE